MNAKATASISDGTAAGQYSVTVHFAPLKNGCDVDLKTIQKQFQPLRTHAFDLCPTYAQDAYRKLKRAKGKEAEDTPPCLRCLFALDPYSCLSVVWKSGKIGRAKLSLICHEFPFLK